MTGREEKNHVASHKNTRTRVNSQHVAASSNSTSCALHNHGRGDSKFAESQQATHIIFVSDIRCRWLPLHAL